ncbi:MAG: heavy-metal-associated domain-containing protein [Ignavibacteriales bacterium]|nr:heavy-metal-associated domain-containing protein [Ignavibacteriales bacterium]
MSVIKGILIMKKQELTIEGMTCGHCVIAVKQSLGMVPNVTVESVGIGKAVVQYDENIVKAEDLVRAVEDAGYTITPEV